jgi:hypothetical protein
MTKRFPSALGGAPDPEQRRILREHLDALFRDMDAGKGEDMDDARLAAFLDDALEDAVAFGSKVREGIAQLDRGESTPHRQVVSELREILGRNPRRPR